MSIKKIDLQNTRFAETYGKIQSKPRNVLEEGRRSTEGNIVMVDLKITKKIDDRRMTK